VAAGAAVVDTGATVVAEATVVATIGCLPEVQEVTNMQITNNKEQQIHLFLIFPPYYEYR
jgi:hypothetical protein